MSKNKKRYCGNLSPVPPLVSCELSGSVTLPVHGVVRCGGCRTRRSPSRVPRAGQCCLVVQFLSSSVREVVLLDQPREGGGGVPVCRHHAPFSTCSKGPAARRSCRSVAAGWGASGQGVSGGV